MGRGEKGQDDKEEGPPAGQSAWESVAERKGVVAGWWAATSDPQSGWIWGFVKEGSITIVVWSVGVHAKLFWAFAFSTSRIAMRVVALAGKGSLRPGLPFYVQGWKCVMRCLRVARSVPTTTTTATTAQHTTKHKNHTTTNHDYNTFFMVCQLSR